MRVARRFDLNGQSIRRRLNIRTDRRPIVVTRGPLSEMLENARVDLWSGIIPFWPNLRVVS